MPTKKKAPAKEPKRKQDVLEAIDAIANSINVEKAGKQITHLEFLDWHLRIAAVRIAHEKLIAMQEQNVQLKEIAGMLASMADSATAMEPKTNRF